MQKKMTLKNAVCTYPEGERKAIAVFVRLVILQILQSCYALQCALPEEMHRINLKNNI